jgi:hypothetical protein
MIMAAIFFRLSLGDCDRWITAGQTLLGPERKDGSPTCKMSYEDNGAAAH